MELIDSNINNININNNDIFFISVRFKKRKCFEIHYVENNG